MTEEEGGAARRQVQQLGMLQQGQADLAERLEAAESALIETEEKLDRMVEFISTKLSALTEGTGTPPPSTDETGEVEVKQTPEELLTDFASKLMEQHYLHSQLRGWHENTSMRAELEALRIGALAAFGDDPGPWDQLSWHDHLARVVSRIGHNEGDSPRDRREKHQRRN